MGFRKTKNLIFIFVVFVQFVVKKQDKMGVVGLCVLCVLCGSKNLVIILWNLVVKFVVMWGLNLDITLETVYHIY